MIIPRGTPLSFIDTTKPSRTMQNPEGYTHEKPQVVERKIVNVKDGNETMEVRIQPNTRKAIK